MPNYKAPLKDMTYLLKDVFQAEQRWASSPVFAHCNQELADTILDEGAKIIEDLVAPLNRAGDEVGVKLVDGDAGMSQVVTPEGYKEAFKTWAENGWMALGGPVEYQGQGMPKMLISALDEMINSACMPFGLYSGLTTGAALAILAHGDEQLKSTYLPKMYSGEWAGAMALTESHAGSDLGIIKTKAEPLDSSAFGGAAAYAITGQKIFITGGDHDLTDNIIHLVLAKLPDAPAGPKGISMFLVPKYKLNQDGSLGERNLFSCGSLEEKMGIHASSTCVMNYDGAEGYLVGEINKGLNAMFTMMNYERVFVGVQGLSCAQFSYQGAVEYAKERLQSRAPGSAKEGAADPIIDHADVSRMLMTQKAFIEPMRALAFYTAGLLDDAKANTEEGGNKELLERSEKLVALLTPVVKAFLTDKGFELAVIGQQVYGGHGYIREWGMEQIVRDARINQIYEGTNGIQAMDLIGRKVLANKGEFVQLFLDEIKQCMSDIKQSQLDVFVSALETSIDAVEDVTDFIIRGSAADPHLPGSAACAYLDMIGYLSCAYMWAKMAKVSVNQDDDFHKAKLITGEFFCKRLLPQITYLQESIKQGGGSTMGLDVEMF